MKLRNACCSRTIDKNNKKNCTQRKNADECTELIVNTFGKCIHRSSDFFEYQKDWQEKEEENKNRTEN